MSSVIAQFDGSDIQVLIWHTANVGIKCRICCRGDFEEDTPSSGMRENLKILETFSRLSYQLWNVNKYGSCVDAAITGLMPPPLL
ncbi:hypothetical protein CQW23_16801 [Capsicum baccatum]|uniref:Uncharacterized protein n=1 Tax=Capsicum baccatum TaxID=33114 RepID=A0A2G2WBY8_CAPBA|nr:hypothetical protein CQW23_16801 [Capsicum baccatum]